MHQDVVMRYGAGFALRSMTNKLGLESRYDNNRCFTYAEKRTEEVLKHVKPCVSTYRINRSGR